MQVELLYHTPDPERAIATAARLCYAPVGASELMETMPEERVKSVLATIMASGHFSTLEHASYTFAVDGVSRALTHQLVRHRMNIPKGSIIKCNAGKILSICHLISGFQIFTIGKRSRQKFGNHSYRL